MLLDNPEEGRAKIYEKLKKKFAYEVCAKQTFALRKSINKSCVNCMGHRSIMDREPTRKIPSAKDSANSAVKKCAAMRCFMDMS